MYSKQKSVNIKSPIVVDVGVANVAYVRVGLVVDGVIVIDVAVAVDVSTAVDKA